MFSSYQNVQLLGHHELNLRYQTPKFWAQLVLDVASPFHSVLLLTKYGIMVHLSAKNFGRALPVFWLHIYFQVTCLLGTQ